MPLRAIWRATRLLMSKIQIGKQTKRKIPKDWDITRQAFAKIEPYKRNQKTVVVNLTKAN